MLALENKEDISGISSCIIIEVYTRNDHIVPQDAHQVSMMRKTIVYKSAQRRPSYKYTF